MIKELNISMSMFELTTYLDEVNILDYIKIMKVKYGIPYTKMAEILGISKQRLSLYINFDSIAMTDEENVEKWVKSLKEYFIN